LNPTVQSTIYPHHFSEVFLPQAVCGHLMLMQYADQLTVLANHAGVPGISIPAGFDRQGLPIGVQLLGPDFSEATLLRIGRTYEMATENEPWRDRKPAIIEGLNHEEGTRENS
jgi:aspartyl-tRNA(Asn)/glutamyl-tRNA(Gln) amidotransferase subunit A